MKKVYVVDVLRHNRFVERNTGCEFIERKRLKIFATKEAARKWVDAHYMEFLSEDKNREYFVDTEISEEDLN